MISILDKPSCTIDEAGQLLGISRSAAYAAAKSGDLPTLRIGRRFVVPTAELRRMLRIDVDKTSDNNMEPEPRPTGLEFSVTSATDGEEAHVFVMFNEMPVANGSAWQHGPLNLDQAEELVSELLLAINLVKAMNK